LSSITTPKNEKDFTKANPLFVRLLWRGRVALTLWRSRRAGNQPASRSMIRSTVQFFGQDFNQIQDRPFQPVWNQPRILRAQYAMTHDARVSDLEIAQEAFHIFNAPDECLTSRQLLRKRDYRSYSMSVGDIVKIWRDGRLVCECLCCPIGWEISYTAVDVE
jgi:hypothetical protein